MSDQRKQSFPCLICGRILLREMDDYEAQPDGGVMCSTGGNYGSTVFDPLNGERLHFNICDDCLKEKRDEGRVFISTHAIPITTTDVHHGATTPRGVVIQPHTFTTQVGWRYTNGVYLQWREDLEPDRRTEDMEIEEILERFDNPQFKWNLTREGYEFMKRELDEFDAERAKEDPEWINDPPMH